MFKTELFEKVFPDSNDLVSNNTAARNTDATARLAKIIELRIKSPRAKNECVKRHGGAAQYP
jgi:hypothetical protein